MKGGAPNARRPKASKEAPSPGPLPRIAVVAARFNEAITRRLVDGCLDTLAGNGLPDPAPVHWVPGALELPLAAQTLALTQRYDAVICLGAVIRGETYHFEVVANEAARGIARASLSTGVPVIFGVLTADTVAQAKARAGAGSSNKGREAALAALEMAGFMRSVK